jgi:hypothetical protein
MLRSESSSVRRSAGKQQDGGRLVFDIEAPTTGEASVPRPVFNLTVEGAHCYYANGVLVHNCDALSRGFHFLTEGAMVLDRFKAMAS